MSDFLEIAWGVQLDDEGSMDIYDTETEARESARGCPLWKITYERIDVN